MIEKINPNKIEELHELLFMYLRNKALKLTDFTFSIRKSDKENRLSKGYYFYGNSGYLAVSFWSGTDWKNKTPNIILVFVPKDEKVYLEISTSDSEKKWEFVKENILPAIPGLNDETGKYTKAYPGNSYIRILEDFLDEDKIKIDDIIKDNQDFFGDLDNENRIGFIEKDAFKLRLEKALVYRENNKKNIRNTFPYYLRQFSINKFAGINKNISIENLPNYAQWIFFTGVNGSGKSSILKALALSLNADAKNYINADEKKYKILVDVYNGGNIISIKSTDKTHKTDIPFAAYGPSRLMIDDFDAKDNISNSERKRRQKDTYSIFKYDGILIDFADEIEKMARNSKNIRYVEKLNIIRETLIECIEPLANIYIDLPVTLTAGNVKIDFEEEDENKERFDKVNFSQISSGSKSLIAMLGDMMVRLFRQQPDIYDIGELRGIILIDEIDIHFHPKQQRSLIEALTNSFPKVQFIVTTHSPIPLLGAPSNSIIFNVKRTVKDGVVVFRLDDKVMFDKIMPNAILSSPIFGVENLISDQKDDTEIPITEDNFNTIALYQRLENDINGFLTNAKQQELINLFANKNETGN